MKFAFVDAERASWPVGVMCRVLGVTRSGFYAWKARPESRRARRDLELGVLVRAAHDRSRTIYGSPRVHAALRRQGVRTSRKRVARLMREQGLQGRFRRRFTSTTDGKHDRPVAENLLNRDFSAAKPNERWVTDVTYLRVPSGFIYLASVLDLYSRALVGWALGESNDRHLALRALDAAVRRRRPGVGLLHHSDRGSPYASDDYQTRLDTLGITCSMSRSGSCLDNAAMESWHATLKKELGEDFDGIEHAKRALFDYIEAFYNGERLHSKLGYQTPRERDASAPVAV